MVKSCCLEMLYALCLANNNLDGKSIILVKVCCLLLVAKEGWWDLVEGNSFEVSTGRKNSSWAHLVSWGTQPRENRLGIYA